MGKTPGPRLARPNVPPFAFLAYLASFAASASAVCFVAPVC